MKRILIFLVCGLMMSAIIVSEVQAQPPGSPQNSTFTQLQTAWSVAGTCGCDVDIPIQCAPPPSITCTLEPAITIPGNVILWMDQYAEIYGCTDVCLQDRKECKKGNFNFMNHI